MRSLRSSSARGCCGPPWRPERSESARLAGRQPDDLVASGCLGLVQAVVGPFDHVVDADVALLNAGETDADGDLQAGRQVLGELAKRCRLSDPPFEV